MNETCAQCGREFKVYDPNEANPSPTYGYGQLPMKDRVYFTSDPFQEEIRGDNTEGWICWDCHLQSAMDI